MFFIKKGKRKKVGKGTAKGSARRRGCPGRDIGRSPGSSKEVLQKAIPEVTG